MPSSYLGRLNETSNLIKKNNQIAQQIPDHGLAFYNIPFPDLLRFQAAHKSDQRPIGDHTSVVQSLNHFVHDWSATGAHERESTFAQILSTLETLSLEGEAGNPRARSRPRQIGVRDKRARVHHRRKRVQLLHVDGARMGAIAR